MTTISQVGGVSSPQGIAVDGAGNVYVADLGNHRVQKFDSSGTFLTMWGSSDGGGGVAGKFNSPGGIAVDGSGNVYVSDTSNTHRIQKFDSTGTYLSQWGSNGVGDGKFSSPWGIAIDGSGNVFVVDASNKRIQKFDSSGTFLNKWSTESSPRWVTVDPSGNVYVTGVFPPVQKFDSIGTSLLTLGSEGSGDGQFSSLGGIASDGLGNVYIVDGVADWPDHNDRIQKFRTDD